MPLDISHFEQFFAAVNDGCTPYAWQVRLLEHVVARGHWPQGIVAPTGAGKSSVIDIHIFANALSATGKGARLPRRLAVSVNRRAIVDQHEERAREISRLLDDASNGVLLDVADALRGLTTNSDVGPVSVVSLRGGVSPTREWLADPGGCAVLAVTPDMWGSRVLFRGYGSSRMAWPREAGLLAIDAALVIDEAHLSRQLEVTARQISALVQHDADRLGIPGLQVVGMTATPVDDVESIGVVETDLRVDEQIARRVHARKTVRYVECPLGTAGKPPTRQHLDTLITVSNDLYEHASACTDGLAPTVGVVVNNVATAIAVADELRRQHGAGAVQCWVGRMRPMDLDSAKAEFPGMFGPAGDKRVRFLVATQTVEVGVDLDLAAMVTELAPGSALAQRFGRVNRAGKREDSRIVVVGPPRDGVGDRLPYVADDLVAAFEWIEHVLAADGDVSPWALSSNAHLQPPRQRIEREVLTVIHRNEVELLAETTVPQFADHDLSFYLRDSLAEDRDPVGFVVRAPLPDDDAAALALVKATPVDPREVFPARIGEAKDVAGDVLGAEMRARIFRWTNGDVSLVAEVDEVRPGDTLVIDNDHAIQVEGVVTSNGDRRTAQPMDWAETDLIAVLVRGYDDAELAEFDNCSDDEVNELAQERYDSGVQATIGSRDELGRLAWVIIERSSAVASSPERRQEWTSAERVTLAQHSAAVADRAHRLALQVGVAEDVAQALRDAGDRHDWGKQDRRFQSCLGARDGVLLAKSAGMSAQVAVRRRQSSGLPLRWRHEQFSAVLAAANPLEGSSELVTRLVGTSHGRGRPFFPHADRDLLDHSVTHDRDVVEVAAHLFENGSGWSQVIENTHREYGVWGCAYLEALLRSADGAVSGEGS